MDIHQFLRVKLSNLWRHGSGETQAYSTTYCTGMCICLDTDRKYVTHSNGIICVECNKRTIYKGVDRI